MTSKNDSQRYDSPQVLCNGSFKTIKCGYHVGKLILFL